VKYGKVGHTIDMATPEEMMKDVGPLRVLFVCVGNSCRSQMAEGLARAMAGDGVTATSAGTSPAAAVAPKALEVMGELGIDISDQSPKLLTRELIEGADRVFIMGCDARDMCPVAWLEGAVDWELEDPIGKGVDKYREVRDLIRRHMEAMLRTEGIEPCPLG
jgi:arsenate reductase